MEKRGRLTKQDYMCMKKERLAELLVERDEIDEIRVAPNTTPYIPYQPPYPSSPYSPWWKEMQIICGYGNN